MPTPAAQPAAKRCRPALTPRQAAVRFAEGVILRSTDWQDVQHALADSCHRAWIDSECGDDELAALALCQAIIGEAEDNLGDRMPSGYA